MPDQLWEEFVKAWGEPIPKMAIAKSAWDHAESAKRAEIVAAARGYWAWLKAHAKPPSAASAQSFIRDQAGWGQWLRYVPDAAGIVPSISTAHPLASAEGKAIVTAYQIAGLGDYLRSTKIRNGAVSYPRPVSPRLLALANAPPHAEWVTLDRNQAGAWEGLISDAVAVQVRNRMREGARAPWPWPPRKDGTLSSTGADHETETQT